MKKIILFLLLSVLMFSCGKKEQEQFSQLSDLDGYTAGVVLGAIHEDYVEKTFKKSKILRLNDYSELLLAMRSGQCDYVLMNKMAAKDILKNNTDIAVFQQVTKEYFGIATQKEDTETLKSFNSFLAEIKENGIYDEMYKRWDVDYDEVKTVDIELVKEGEELVVGTSGIAFPFTILKNGKLIGLDIEMMERYAASIGRPVKFIQLPFNSLIISLATGKIDAIASSLTITEERKKQVAFSDPYYESGSVVLCMKDRIAKSHDDNNSQKDFSKSRIGVMTGTIGEFYVREHYKSNEPKCYDNIMDAIAALQSDKLDYVMTSYTTAVVACRSNKKLVILPEKYSDEGAVISIKKGVNPELLSQINERIREYKKSGLLDEMIKRWIDKAPDTEYDIPDIPQHENGKVLRVGTAANREPMMFVYNNSIQGLDSELIRRIAYDLGYCVEFTDMSFSALVVSLTTDKVDVLIANMVPTAERAKIVDFSESYYVNPQIMMCLGANLTSVSDKENTFWNKMKDSFYSNLILEKRYKLIFNGLWETVIISVFSILIGVILGSLICFLRMSKSKLASGFAKTYIDLIRGIPILVLLMIMFYVIFSSVGINATIVAIITFAINLSAYVSEMFRTSIQGVDKGQTEAGVALGFTKTQTFIYIVLPQAVKTVLPVFKGSAISLIKTTSIVGYIAIQDLTKASDIIRSRTFDAFFPLIIISIIYFILAWLLGLLLDRIGRKVNSR